MPKCDCDGQLLIYASMNPWTVYQCDKCKCIEMKRWQPTCDQCLFYKPDDETTGECRRRPPLASHSWPEVSDHDWCGEHEAR
jgi:hypothetical protein